MNTSSLQALYGPQLKKSLRTVLCSRFRSEYSFLGGEKVIQLIVDDVLDIVDKHQIPLQRINKGQILWLAVSADAPKGQAGRMDTAPQVPVVLNLVTDDDIVDLENGVTVREIRKRVSVRLVKEAREQGGSLACTDVGIMMRISPNTVAGYIREVEAETGELLPTRGLVHDLGRKISHKVEFVRRVKVQGLSPPVVAKQLNHSLPDGDRYLDDFERVALLSDLLEPQQIARITRMGLSLVNEYLQIKKDIEGKSSSQVEAGGKNT